MFYNRTVKYVFHDAENSTTTVVFGNNGETVTVKLDNWTPEAGFMKAYLIGIRGNRSAIRKLVKRWTDPHKAIYIKRTAPDTTPDSVNTSQEGVEAPVSGFNESNEITPTPAEVPCNEATEPVKEIKTINIESLPFTRPLTREEVEALPVGTKIWVESLDNNYKMYEHNYYGGFGIISNRYYEGCAYIEDDRSNEAQRHKEYGEFHYCSDDIDRDSGIRVWRLNPDKELTPDEVRQMDGEVIWIESADPELAKTKNGWSELRPHRVMLHNDKCSDTKSGACWTISNIGCHNRAYIRKQPRTYDNE